MQEDYVLGLGRQTSVRQITALCSTHVQRIEGGPKTLKMRGPGIKITAERDDYESEFTRFTVRGRISADFAAKLRQSIEESGGHCDLVQDENSHVLTDFFLEELLRTNMATGNMFHLPQSFQVGTQVLNSFSE